MSQQSIFQRPATWILESIGLTLWGFKPNLMQELVKQNGSWEAITWIVKNMPRYNRILKTWGPIRTHIISVFVSTLNGCPYCIYGHAYAFQLHYLKENNILFPLDETDLIALHTLEENEILARLEAALNKTGLTEGIPYLKRILELKQGNTAERPEDDYLLHLIGMFSTLNACGIQADVAIDEAHDPINKDTILRERYAALRSSEATLTNQE